MQNNMMNPTLCSPWRRRALLALLALPILLLLAECVRVVLYTNRHTVIAGRVYRCSQPSGNDVRELVQQHGIRTVINLRGLSPDFPWYADECQTCHELNISQEDITLSANRLPPPAELRRLVEILEQTQYPILVHCKAGADRTGLVSMMVLLLQTDIPLHEARRQLLPRYGHFRFGRTAAMDDFFDIYDAWLARENLTHTSAHFRDWVLKHYQPGVAVSKLAWLDTMPMPAKAGETFGVRVRAENRSSTAWQLKPGTYSGVHLAFAVFNDKSESVWSGRAGLRNETVLPGHSTDVMIPIIGMKPGKYTVIVEVHDATEAGIPFRTNSFVQYGDESLAADLVVE